MVGALFGSHQSAPMTEEEYYMGDGVEPSEHEKLVEQKRMERLLKSQMRSVTLDLTSAAATG